MINYTTYIAAKKANSDSVFYLEMLPYFISEFDEACCQRNGYEQCQIINDFRLTEL